MACAAAVGSDPTRAERGVGVCVVKNLVGLPLHQSRTASCVSLTNEKGGRGSPQPAGVSRGSRPNLRGELVSGELIA